MVSKIHYVRYLNFIQSRKLRIISKNTYLEKHHILPKSLGGNDEKDNLILLTAREHYISHMILHKAYKGKMTNV